MIKTLTTAMVGVGQWGSNVLRNLAAAERCEVKYLCDSDVQALSRQAGRYPNAKTVPEFGDLLADEDLHAIVIATEAPTHYNLAAQALAAGKHVFIEKPMTLKARDAAALASQAESSRLKLMAGHLLVFHPAFEAVNRMITAGEIGNVYYIYTHRLNLGIVRREENAWWSLAPHDVAVICRIFEADPIAVSAVGQCYLQKDIEDVVFATLKFGDGRMGHIHVSWLDPHKIRKMTIVGSRKMITWDDMSPGEKLRVYDKGVVAQNVTSYADAITLRIGDIVIPKTASYEPLQREIQHFIDCCLDDLPVLTDGAEGLRVVRVLEAGQKSLENQGLPVDPRQLD